MKALPTASLWAVIALLSLACCDPQVPYRQIPFTVQRYFSTLPVWQKPKKVQIDRQHGKVYWLNQNGEIHAIRTDGSRAELVNKGIGAKLGITFIHDFALDVPGNTIYFTDWMDVSTGLSAIKRSDLQGADIQLVATLSAEMPYAIFWDAASRQLYYLSKRESNDGYHLHLLGETAPLAVTDHRVKDIPALLGELSAIQIGSHTVADQSVAMF